jgi:phage N-6-adenine-methyltransferase
MTAPPKDEPKTSVEGVCPTCGRGGPRLKQSLDERQDYETPPELFLSLSQEFGPFDLDVAANAVNHKVPRWFGPGGEHEDALNGAVWAGKCWMNPPYGSATRAFMRRASEAKALVVCLVPARTDTRWWHETIPKAKEVRFLKGRPKFWLDGKPKLAWDKRSKTWRPASGKFPSAVVVFDGR